MLASLEAKIVACGIVLVVLCLGIITFGIHERSVGRDNYKKEIEKAQVKYSASTKKVTTKVVTKYVDRVKVIKEKGETITKRVPVYVTAKDDSMCTINNGFSRLWNSANQMSVSGTASIADGSASSLILSDVAAQHVREANLYATTAAQLEALQDWIREQQALSR